MTNPQITATNADYLAPVNTNMWVNGRHEVRCMKVVQETWDVRTFCFVAQQPVMFFFKPGQFVTLELEIDGKQVMRSYTISSSPSVPYSFSITVKRVPGGLVSNWLHDNIVEGSELAVHGPVGNFNLIDFYSDKVLLLSGGVGITPVMSMARWLFDTSSNSTDMHFIHSSRTPSDIIYRRELEHIFSRVPEFKMHIVCEKSDEVGEAWSGYRGYLNLSMLELMTPDYLEREIFCCGPTPYMRAVKRMLEEAGFDMTRYHEESFGETPAEDKADAIEQADAAQAEAEAFDDADLIGVEIHNSGMTLETQVVPGETLHQAAAKVNLHIPKACGMGICGTCKVLVKEGETHMEANGGITDEDIAAGYVLSCCTVAKSDVVIEY